MSYSSEKKELVEFLGMHLEKRTSISPLAARIQALMILSPSKGNSFDEIVTFTEASKSSVSSNLNLLIQMKIVEYFTIPGDRKRYFRASQDHLCIKLKEYLEHVKEEILIVNRINAFNERHNKITYKRHENVGGLFQEFLESQKEIIETTLSKMQQNLKPKNTQ